MIMAFKSLKPIAFGLISLAVISGIWFFIAHEPKAEFLFKPDDKKIVTLGKELYGENCASCHGAQLEGEPNWRIPKPNGLLPAPPHDEGGHTWHHPEQQLFSLTKVGLAKMLDRPEIRSGMPAFEGVLTDAEIIAVLSYIKSTWPADVRERHDAMDRQSRGKTAQ